jgi:hypothetical protein
MKLPKHLCSKVPDSHENKGVYIIGSKKHSWFKIGMSCNISLRLKEIASGIPFQVEVIRAFPVLLESARFDLETLLHVSFNHKKIKGEWFSLTSEDIEECGRIASKSQ